VPRWRRSRPSVAGSGRLAVVTGSSRGLGAELATELVGLGTRVVLAARDPRHVPGPSDLQVLLPVDLRNVDQVRGLASQVLTRYGVPDLIVNAAGAGRYGPLSEAEADSAMATFLVNAVAPLMLINAFRPAMEERGTGAIVNVSSLAALAAMPGLGVYGASKAALDGLTRALRRELEGTTITTLLVRPGRMATGFFAAAGFPEAPRDEEHGYAAPSDIARLIVRNLGRDGEYVIPADRWLVKLHRHLSPRAAERVGRLTR
jgi:uncharacterized protein